MTTHTCLARSGPAPTAPGDAPDCPDCRAALLQAFREPARTPETFRPAAPALPDEHRVDYSVGTHPDGVSGTWMVSCMSPGCGFVREGFYGPRYDSDAPDAYRDRRHAYRACQHWIDHHKQNPGENACLEPELCTAADPCPVCEEAPPEPGLSPAEHVVSVSVLPPLTQWRLGSWSVVCGGCGWRRTGRYGSSTVSAPDFQQAESLAQAWARYHKTNPTREN